MVRKFFKRRFEMNHEQDLNKLLDNLEEAEVETLEWSQANTLVNQYFAVALLLGYESIPASLIWRTYKISIRQLGCRRTLKAVALGIRIALFS
jgi:hypothetical protein